jgi:hypothetical protein
VEGKLLLQQQQAEKQSLSEDGFEICWELALLGSPF